MSQSHPLRQDEIIFLSDGSYTVGAVKAGDARHVFIETETEELVQFLEKDDLIAVSAFSGGEAAKRSIACMLYLVRDGHMPLLVLPEGHPATKRLPLVISAGPSVRLTSCIIPGTHPEQDVLCARGGLDGTLLRGTPGGIAVEGGRGYSVERSPCLFYGYTKEI